MKTLSSKLKPGFAPILLVGIVVILGVVLGVVFGPKIGFNLGQLGQRQAEQESYASHIANDPDGDAFSNDLENKIGTDSSKSCLTQDPGGSPSTVWPLDLKTGNTSYNKINIEDLASFKAPINRLNTKTGMPNYDKRWDLDGNGKIDVVDLARLTAGPTAYPEMLGFKKAFGGEQCKHTYFLRSDLHGSQVNFTWTPGLADQAYGRIVVGESCGNWNFNDSLATGATTYTWNNGQVGKYYCAAIYGSNAGSVISNYITFKVGDPSVTPTSRTTAQ